MSILTVALIQQTCSSDRDDNISKTTTAIRLAANQGAQLVVLQELHTGLYFCQAENTDIFDQAETIPGPSTKQFGELAAELGT